MKTGAGWFAAVSLACIAAAFAGCGHGADAAIPAAIVTRAPLTATPTDTPTPEPTSTPEPTPTPTPAPVRVASGGGGGGSGVSASRRPGPPPVSLVLPSLGVNSAIEQIGLVNNQLDTPHNPYNTGWYYTYDAPGQGGNAVFAAHVDYFPNIKGPFNQLSRMAVGDEVDVATGDGNTYTYTVISNTRYEADSIPMGALIWPAKPEDEDRVTLITCGGRFVATQASGAGEYLDRDVVIATRRRD